MTTLWHYTCDHGRAGIGKKGTLKPHPSPILHGVKLVWLTSNPDADYESMGLQSTIIDCDRMAYRYVVKSHQAEPWTEFRVNLDPRAVYVLEFERDPSCWWVSRVPVKAELDRAYVPGAGMTG